MSIKLATVHASARMEPQSDGTTDVVLTVKGLSPEHARLVSIYMHTLSARAITWAIAPEIDTCQCANCRERRAQAAAMGAEGMQGNVPGSSHTH